VAGGDGFYFDLAEPRCWPAAELLPRALPTLPFRPVRAAALGIAVEPAEPELWERCRELGLLTPRPPRQPAQAVEEAVLAAVYAASIGKGIAFALAAFRQAFAAGRDLASWDNVVIVGAACEIHPRALAAGARSPATGKRLEENEQRARSAGVEMLPAALVEGRLVEGLEEVVALAGQGVVG